MNNPDCPNCKTHNQVFSTNIISDFSKKHWKNKKWHCNKCEIQFDEMNKLDRLLELAEKKGEKGLWTEEYDILKDEINNDLEIMTENLTIKHEKFKDNTHYFSYTELPEVHGWDKSKEKALSELFNCMAGYLEAFPEKCVRFYPKEIKK